MNRFVVGTGPLDKMAVQAFTKYLSNSGAIWWHWLPNFYLVIDKQDKLDLEKIRDKIVDLGNFERCLVLEFEKSGMWAGFGPESDEQSMFKWLHNHWDKD